MNFSLYIARRYLVSRKSHNIINIISVISVIGVAIGTMALIIVLSVFNGFDRLVVSLFSSFNPSFQITPVRGKTFPADTLLLNEIRKIPGVLHLAEVIEENALMKYQDEQCIVTIKGVSEEFLKMSGLDTMIVEGKFLLQEEDKNFTVLGIGVAGTLNANLQDYLIPISVYVPRRDASFSASMDQAFNTEVIFPSGFFQVQWEFDVKYALVPLRFAKTLFQYDRERTAIEIGTVAKADQSRIQKQIETLAGPGFRVKNRFQQQEILYKIMISEKNYIFMILTLILIIATFNVIGTLSMLILDKKKDIAVLQSMGASQKVIKRIFLAEGMLISMIGAISGLALGAIVCYLQMKFGFVRLGDADSSFVVNAYPVYMQFRDFLMIFITVMVIGLLATWYPVSNIKKIHLSQIKLD
ncbi:MAG: FtsX-like permease family protein [Alphaproteobacteria bacterium]|nr:FtsX-like permease family protein [Alphaproteobacteria bacterium]